VIVHFHRQRVGRDLEPFRSKGCEEKFEGTGMSTSVPVAQVIASISEESDGELLVPVGLGDTGLVK
jgi:hypothetical protein